MNHDESRVSPALEQAMQNAWDAGNDPADDPVVQQLLEQDPTQLEGFVAWRAQVASMRELPAGVAGSPPRSTRVAAAAAVLLLTAGAAAALAWGDGGHSPGEPSPNIHPPQPAANPVEGFFLSEELVIHRETIQHNRSSQYRRLISQPDTTLSVIETTILP